MNFEDTKQKLRGRTGDEYPQGSLQEALKDTTEGVDVVTSDRDQQDNEEIDRGG